MVAVLVGMGSNIHPEEHLTSAAAELREHYPEITFSAVYRSRAVGMEGDDFLNACCLIQGVTDRMALVNWCKALEDRHGRDRSEGSWKPRTLDLDLLMFGEEVVDDDLFRYPHVYLPASELIDLEVPDAAGDVALKVGLSL
ncbi:MAG: 2-amino-4-hydroxy-6-hydroxymethyldihydropteridine diphosphokinase [Mariprofundaceae bacterium]|nr:2-amino-4-hydroxy-6-hydroxymethyldihydropteridine diphosphokinase [Mariprofundaceae bacterium]